MTLTPAPGNGDVFTGWADDCSGNGPCSVTMNGDKFVRAYFYPGSCAYAISSTAKSLTGKGGAITIGVTAKGYTYCPAPVIVDNAGWITYAATPFSNNSGSVKLAIPALDSSIDRSGTLTIGGKTFTVNQKGAPCSLTLHTSSALFPAGGGPGGFNVTLTPADCAYAATPDSKSSWLHVTGTSSSEVDYSVDANTGTVARSGKIAVTLTLSKKSKSFTVRQGD